MNKLTFSPLGKTWILDLDGTIVKHNGYKIDGFDTFLDGAEAFLKAIPKTDLIVFITSRSYDEKTLTEDFLKKNNITYESIIYNAPYGERILINDKKPSGLDMAYAVNTQRDFFTDYEFLVDSEL